jgi:hypothetical protein
VNGKGKNLVFQSLTPFFVNFFQTTGVAMAQDRQFNIRVSDQDRQIIQAVAQHMQRTDSDAVRVIFRELYSAIKAADQAGEVKPTGQEQRAA